MLATQPGPGSPIYRVLGCLEGVKKQGSGYEARCPGSRHKHGDKRPSLSVGIGLDGRVLLNCHTGCSTEEILGALGLTFSDLFEKSSSGNVVRRFRSVDQMGVVVATHVREDLPGGDKKVWWETNGKRGLNGTPSKDLPLYGLLRLLERPDEPVFVCEGEKAADALAELGLLAVGTVTGASETPSAATLEPLQGRDVILWPDNDPDGLSHMQAIARGLQRPPRWVSWTAAPEKGDAADYVATGGSAESLQSLVVERLPRAALAKGPRLDIVRMADVKPEAINWHWRGRFAKGKATLMMGDPGLGKSLITHWIAARTSTGGEWPDGGMCEQGTAVLFTIEDGLADTVAPRLIAAGADMQRVIAVRGVLGTDDSLSERMFALTEHLQMLEDLIVRERAVFVVMDPVTAYLGPDVNSHKETEVRAVLGPLQMMAERTGIALAMLMHLNKGTGVSALYRAVGSIAFPAVARVVLGVAPDPNDEDGKRRLLLPIKMNIGKLPEGIGYRIETAADRHVLRRASDEDQPPILVWDREPVTIDAASAMDRNGAMQEMGALEECKRALHQILASGPVAARDGERQLKDAQCWPSQATLIRARRELGIKVKKEGFGGQWFWYPPEGFTILPTTQPMDGLESMESMEHPPSKTLKTAMTPNIPKSTARAREEEDVPWWSGDQ